MSQDIRILACENAEKTPFDWGHLTWFANRPQGNSDTMTIGRCVLNPGMGNPRHYHPNCSEILVVVQGRIRHTAAGGETKEMNEGDTVTIPPNVWHHAHNMGDTEAVLFIAFDSADRKTIGE